MQGARRKHKYPRPRTSCAVCHMRKVKCDHRKPCSQCLRLGQARACVSQETDKGVQEGHARSPIGSISVASEIDNKSGGRDNVLLKDPELHQSASQTVEVPSISVSPPSSWAQRSPGPGSSSVSVGLIRIVSINQHEVIRIEYGHSRVESQ